MRFKRITDERSCTAPFEAFAYPMRQAINRIQTFLLIGSLVIVASSIQADEEKTAKKLAASKEALAKLKLPGVKVDVDEWCVDVEAVVCLHHGLLEFIACTKDSKEHESIIAVTAAPSHIHTALLLLGAEPGSPAHQRAINEERTQWLPVDPSGHPVDVSLLVPDKKGKLVERKIEEFIAGKEEIDPTPGFETADGEDNEKGEEDKFPTNTFVFAGSIIQDARRDTKGPRKYLADLTGSVISISTFGDELLCLPGVHGQGNDSLRWSVDSTHLPKVGEKVTLRLRPKKQD